MTREESIVGCLLGTAVGDALGLTCEGLSKYGPAMRSALLGVCYGEQPEQLSAFVRATTQITHTDPKAELGALVVALAGR